jgi:RNA polymerase I-specific transcription initiation factor RRN7
MLNIDFTYPNIRTRNEGILAHPEIQLMSLIVVATKLAQPFDDIVRHPESESDPTLLKIDWKSWRQTMTEKPVEGLRRGEEIKVEDEDVLTMGKEKIDDYLDWFQRTWIDTERPDKSKLQLLSSSLGPCD